MSNDSSTFSASTSTLDFLSTLEQSGVLSESGIHAIRGRVGSDPEPAEASALATRLVEQGNLTEFQARRLLVGKSKGLVFGRYILLDRLGIGAMGRVFKARHRLMDRVVALKIVLPVCATSQEVAHPVLPRDQDRRHAGPSQRGPGLSTRTCTRIPLHRDGVPGRRRPGEAPAPSGDLVTQ